LATASAYKFGLGSVGESVMSWSVRTIFATLVLAGIAATPAFSPLLSQIQDRDRPEFRPAISGEALPVPDESTTRVPLPRARPKMSAAIPLPRPAPASLTAVTTPIQPEPASAESNISSPETVPSRPAAPTTAASPKAGDIFMPIPPMPLPFRNETDASSGALSTRDSRKAE
jgi:hypothetical protein